MHQCIKFILFWNDTLHVSDGLSVHNQEFETEHTATGMGHIDNALCLIAGTRRFQTEHTATGMGHIDNALCLIAGTRRFQTVHTATGICQTDIAVCLLAGTRWFQLVPASKQTAISV